MLNHVSHTDMYHIQKGMFFMHDAPYAADASPERNLRHQHARHRWVGWRCTVGVTALSVAIGAAGVYVGANLSKSRHGASTNAALVEARRFETVSSTQNPNTLSACVANTTHTDLLPSPVRVLDSRFGLGTTKGIVPAGSTTVVSVAHLLPGASAVLGTFTVADAAGRGYYTLWSGASPRPRTSNLNTFAGGEDVADAVEVPLSSTGTFSIYNQNAANLIFDVSGGVVQQSGALHLLTSTTSSCPTGTKEITWDVQGPAGPAGASGPAGPTGPAGATGATGPAGPGAEMFLSSGTYTVPSGVEEIEVRVWGGGGGGGAGAGFGGSGGGGGGAFITGFLPVAACGGSVTVNVGTGGKGGSSGSSGTPGGTSYVTCSSNGIAADGGGGGAGNTASGGGGAAGQAGKTTGANLIRSTAGTDGSGSGGSSGGAGGENGAGFNAGGGGTSTLSGASATGPGGGGGGGGSDGGDGGAGGAGLVVIIPFTLGGIPAG